MSLYHYVIIVSHDLSHHIFHVWTIKPHPSFPVPRDVFRIPILCAQLFVGTSSRSMEAGKSTLVLRDLVRPKAYEIDGIDGIDKKYEKISGTSSFNQQLVIKSIYPHYIPIFSS